MVRERDRQVPRQLDLVSISLFLSLYSSRSVLSLSFHCSLYGVVLHSSSHVVDPCSVIQSLSVSVTACAGDTPVQAVTGPVPVSVLVAVLGFLWELMPGRYNGFDCSVWW